MCYTNHSLTVVFVVNCGYTDGNQYTTKTWLLRFYCNKSMHHFHIGDISDFET